MDRYKYLFKNIGLLTLSSFATKLLSFFLVPLYTNILTTTEYGTYDLFNTTIGVLIPILTLNIQDSVMRFSLDNEDTKPIIYVGVRYTLLSGTIACLALTVNYIFNINVLIKEYTLLLFLLFLTNVFSGIILAYTRGTEKINDLSVSSVICSLVIIVCNIIFLVVFKWGLAGYFLSNILGPIIQIFYLIVRLSLFKDISLAKRDKTIEREMLIYSVPMIANSIAWWVNNASDKYFIVFFCGMAVNGVYSVASKIPSIINIFQSIFSQAWTLSAVKEFDAKDKSGFFTNVYKTYNAFMVLGCSSIIFLNKTLSSFLYAKDFYDAWRYVPWLTIAIVFGSLSGYLGGFFSAVKDSKIQAQSTVIGAISNVVLNAILVPVIGALGAAIATAICYIEIWVVRYCCSKKYIKLQIDIKRDVLTYFLLIIQAIIIMFDKNMISGIVFVIFILICLLYIKDIKELMLKLIRKGKI